MNDAAPTPASAKSLPAPTPPAEILPNGTGGPDEVAYSKVAANFAEARKNVGDLTWLHIFEAAVSQVFSKTENLELDDELDKVIALAKNWQADLAAAA